MTPLSPKSSAPSLADRRPNVVASDTKISLPLAYECRELSTIFAVSHEATTRTVTGERRLMRDELRKMLYSWESAQSLLWLARAQCGRLALR